MLEKVIWWKAEYNLLPSDWFRYLQITDCLRQNPQLRPKIPVSIQDYLTSPNNTTKGISTIYPILQEKSVFTKPTPLLKWEQDIGTTFTPSQWTKAFTVTHKNTLSASLCEMMQKITLRWYLTPDTLAKYRDGSSSSCWRGCSQEGTIMHIFWKCPLISKLWEDVSHLISSVTGQKTTLTPDLALLHINLVDVPKRYRKIVLHILLSTKLVLARKWKTSNIPTLLEIIDTTHTHHTYELMMTPDYVRYQKEKSTWSPWIEWYNNCSDTNIS